MHGRPRRMTATVVTGGLVVVAALAGGCSGSPPSSTRPPGGTTSTTAATSVPTSAGPPVGNLPPVGTYTDGPQGTPHYTLVLTTSSATSLAGSVNFIFQDGRTQTVFTFSGTPSTGNASLTTSSGKTVSATYTSSSITLASCTTYLQYAANDSECTFAG
jgi:hypothetical protein